MGIIVLIIATAVVAEFGLHVIYHAKTGRAGLMDPPFDYLKELLQKLEDKHDV